MSDTAWVQLASILTLVIGFLWQAWREARNRRWDQEDRRLVATALAESTAEKAEVIKTQIEEQNTVIQQAHQDIKDKIDDNTVKTIEFADEARLAIKVANSMNEKLLRLTRAIQSVQPLGRDDV